MSCANIVSCILRAEGTVEVVHYTPIGGVPQSATAQDLGVDNPLAIRGDVSSEGGPTPSTSPGENGVNSICYVG